MQHVSLMGLEQNYSSPMVDQQSPHETAVL